MKSLLIEDTTVDERMQIVKEAPDTPVEGIIKKALKML